MPAPHLPPYPHPAEPYGAGDMEVDPPSANYSAQSMPFTAPINSAQYPPPYPPPGPYYNNYEPSYNNFHSHANTVPARTTMTPVTQPPPRPVTAVTSPQKVTPTQAVTAPSVTPVTNEVSNQHEDEDRLVIDLGELDESSEDSSASDRSAHQADTPDWMLNISRIKQQLAEKEKRRAKNSTKAVSAANSTATTTAPSDDKTANDKPALADKEQLQTKALAEKEQRIQRLKDEIARRERELQSKKQASKDEPRAENSVNESDGQAESRDQQPISNKQDKRPRSQSDPHQLDELRAAKRARVTSDDGTRTGNTTKNNTTSNNNNTSSTQSSATPTNNNTLSSALSTAGPNTASKNSSQSRVMTLEDRARVLREKTAEEHAIISARDQRNKLSAELTTTQHDVLRSRAQLSTAERNILFLEEKLRIAREEREKLLQIRKDQESKCHVLEEQMREIDRDMERRLHVIAEHDHVLQVNDLQLELDQSEHSAVSASPDTTVTPPSNLGNTDVPIIAKPSATPPVKATLPNKEIEIIDVDDVPTPPVSKSSKSPAVPGATLDETALRQQALHALQSPHTSKAERRRARRKLRQLANSGGSTATPVTVTPAPVAESGRPSDTPFMNETDQHIVSKVRALKAAVTSDAVLVHDWPSDSTEWHEPALHRTVTLTGLDDHVIVDVAADIPHIPATETEGANYSAVLHSLDSTDETDLRVSATQLAVPYESPLSVFSSYRLTPHCSPQQRTAVTWSNKINPHVMFCKYDLHGTCNDDECHAQHVRDVQLSGEELLRDLASYIEDPNKSRAENESAITALLKQVRGTILSERVDSVIRLVNQQLQARDPAHRGIVFTPRHRTLTRKTVPQQAPTRRDKRAVKSGTVPRDVPHEDEEDVLVVEELQDDEQPVLHLLDSEHAQLMHTAAHERYFHAHLSNHQVEQLLTEQPHNIALWLQYSATQLHEHGPHSLTAPLLWDEHGHWLDATNLVRELSPDSSATSQSEITVDAALHVLSRALEHNRRSVVLWYYYLRLYIPRAPSREELIRTIDQGLSFTAENNDNTNWTLWCL